MTFIAHIRQSDDQEQTVEEHLLGVKKLAESYGAKLDIKHITGLAGMLHDLGKYTEEFRSYILEAVHHPDAPPRRGSVDHSTAGGHLLYQRYHTENMERYKGLLAEIVGNAVISHHSYLQDFLNAELESNYLKRVRDKGSELKEFKRSVQLFFQYVISEKNFSDYVEQAAHELKNYLSQHARISNETKCTFLSKFVFSALIDADRTNSRCFEENKPDDPISSNNTLFRTFYDRLLNEIESFAHHPLAGSPINKLRRQMSDQCDRFAVRPSGIYTLSIPTGGGKTLASLRYALKHAIEHGKNRIIYVLPYTTIIEQNAAEVRRILEDEAQILEHHSNVIEDNDDNDESMDGLINIRQKLKLAKDNWDSPIIFTTMVQFLNVFYAQGSRNIRRLHNLSESILIFDEVQKVPVSCVSLFNEALNFLSASCHSSIVLCTATQPALDFVEHKLQVSPEAEMIENLNEVIEAFKRVEIADQASDQVYTNEQLGDFILERMQDNRNMLIILNTKSVVKRLYQQLLDQVDEDIYVYHLSTSMCAAHRKKNLEEIRDHLKAGRKLICVSTPLIEAGVDVSFECVIRSLAGLDSIAQAAGRCNRHGESETRKVYIIDHAEENLSRLKEVEKGKQITKKILVDLQRDPSNHGGHLLSKKAMTKYFREFYKELGSSLDYSIPKIGKKMTTLLFGNLKDNSYFQDYKAYHQQRLPLFLANSYKTAADHFHVIDDLTTSVIVPYGEEGRDIIAELNGDGKIEDYTRLLRKAQQFTVNMFNFELQLVDQNGGLEHCLDGQVLVLKDGAYNEEFGLDTENDSWSGGLIT